METKIATLESMGAWDVVERNENMNGIQQILVFKCKRYPDGLIKRFKALFCARGYEQLEVINIFNTYSLVVKCTTVLLMITLEILLGLKSKQGDVSADFLHANIGEGKNVYADKPKGFEKDSKTGRKKCLKLKNTLYGLRQSPCEIWQYLKNKLEVCDLKRS